MATILVIEDEPALLKVLDYNLKQAGHEVLLAPTGRDGVRLAIEQHPDLVLLDQMLPDMQGTEVCRTLQNNSNTRDVPIMFVTARSDEIDRVVAFELGAVDYVVKPFSIRELLLRIQAILKRTRTMPQTQQYSEFGILRIDKNAHRVWVNDVDVTLTLLEFKLLVTLYENHPRVQSRERLLETVWGIAGDDATRTVDAHIKRLRDKLGNAGWYIKTVRGLGYQFAASPRCTFRRMNEARKCQGCVAHSSEKGGSQLPKCILERREDIAGNRSPSVFGRRRLPLGATPQLTVTILENAIGPQFGRAASIVHTKFTAVRYAKLEFARNVPVTMQNKIATANQSANHARTKRELTRMRQSKTSCQSFGHAFFGQGEKVMV